MAGVTSGARDGGRWESRVLRATAELAALAPPPVRGWLARPIQAGSSTPDAAARACARVTVRVALALAVALVVLQLGQELVLGDPVAMLDADEEHNLWTWTHVAVQLATCFSLLLLAAQSSRRAPLWFAAATMLFLSLDEFLEIHGRLADELVFFPHAGRLIWPMLYLPLLGALLVVLWRTAEPDHDSARALVRAGLALLVTAVVLELASVGIFLVADGFGVLYNIEVALEEGAEGAGWLMVAGGFASVVLSRPGTGQAATSRWKSSREG